MGSEEKKVPDDKAEEEEKEEPLIEKICTRTTCHGVADLYEATWWPTRIMWGVILIGSMIAMVYYIYYVIIGYMTSNIATSIGTKVVDELAFPDAVACTFHRLDFTKVDAVIMRVTKGTATPGTRNEFMLYLSYFFNSGVTPFKTPEVEQIYASLMAERSTSLTPLKDYLISVSIPCRAFVQECLFAAKTFDCCYGTEPIFTDQGVCWRIKVPEFAHAQRISGVIGGLEIRMNFSIPALIPKNRENEPLWSDRGFRVFVGSYATRNDHNFVNIPTGTHGYLQMKLSRHSVLPEYSDCVILDYDYSTELCYSECDLIVTYQQCKCINVWSSQLMPSVDACEPFFSYNCTRQTGSLREAIATCQEERCPVACDNQEVSIRVTYANIYKQMGQTKATNDIAVASVYFSEMSHNQASEEKILDESGLVANIGGIMGAWTGMSLLTFIQAAYYTIEHYYRRRKAANEAKKGTVVGKVAPVKVATGKFGTDSPAPLFTITK